MAVIANRQIDPDPTDDREQAEQERRGAEAPSLGGYDWNDGRRRRSHGRRSIEHWKDAAASRLGRRCGSGCHSRCRG